MSKLTILSILYLFFGLFVLTISCEDNRYPHGQALYNQYCSNCHMDNGEGLGQIYPALSKSSYLSTEQSSLVCLIRHGKKSTEIETVYMPANDNLSDIDMINLINFLSYKWGENAPLSPQEVKEALNDCP